MNDYLLIENPELTLFFSFVSRTNLTLKFSDYIFEVFRFNPQLYLPPSNDHFELTIILYQIKFSVIL